MKSDVCAQDRFRGCLVGLATGDALGTTVEFRDPGSFIPLTDIVGGGPFGLKPGEWTDDTSMALCLGESLLTMNGFDAQDQMQKYVEWRNNGYMSSNGHCFDIGNTGASALRQFETTGDPYAGSTHPRSAGNGSIMRLAPVPMYYANDAGAAIHWSQQSSRTTHGALECLDSCRLLAGILFRALNGADKSQLLSYTGKNAGYSVEIELIALGHYKDKDESEISGSGYVVESLEAALWCFHHTDSFAEAVLRAANLGNDADTTAAICGQVAGAYYGLAGIPADWVNKLARSEVLHEMADRLYEVGATT